MFMDRESRVHDFRLFFIACEAHHDGLFHEGADMTPVVFIDGDQGTTGLQILQRLQGRTDIALRTLPPAVRKDEAARRAALNECDIALLCLPDAAAREAVAWIENPHVRVIDASSAHRTTAGWTYGLPELDAAQAELIAQSKRVTNPGCYPTGAIALLKPLVAAGLVPPDYPFAIHAVSGYSGMGRAGVEQYEGAQAAGLPALQVYGLDLRHKHVPEMQQHAGLTARPIFVPAYGAFRQGIALTVPLHLRHCPVGVTPARLHAALAAHYHGHRHVRVMPLDLSAGGPRLDAQALNGTNDLQLTVAANENAGQVVLAAVFDNLGKGASGAAVQNLDLMLRG
jgi:N-acetyl-gamma-glutamyl-phosphate reductase